MSNKSKQSKHILPGLEPSPGFTPIKQLETEAKGTPKGKTKVSSHLIEQRQKYDYPPDNTSQLSIFDQLQEETQRDIKEAQIEHQAIVEGIQLSPSETKLIDSLCNLLHNNSQNQDPKKPNYFTGNTEDTVLVNYLGEETIAPKLAFTLYELTKAYKGGGSPSGKEMDNLSNVLQELNNKRFLIRYTETTKAKSGEWIKKEYEAYRKLIDVDKAILRRGKEDIEYYRKTETVIVLNPIFRSQIDSKFILYPSNINKRTEIAYGNAKVSEITLRLRDHLLMLHSNINSRKYNNEIGLERLYFKVAEKWMKQGRKKRVKEALDKALETMQNLGLLLSYEVKAGATGEPKIIFKLNKNWD